MKSWTPLWSGIVDSSIWDEPDYVLKVFLTMLALKGSDFTYQGSAYSLSRQSRKTELEVLEALKILSSPDTRRIEPQPFNGRRIKAVEGGWLILNAEKYRSLIQKEMRRNNNRKAQATFRQKQKLGATHSERRFSKAVDDGDLAQQDRLTGTA